MTITKTEWRRRCIAHLRKHGSDDYREYKDARRAVAALEKDQVAYFGASGLAWQQPEDAAQAFIGLEQME